MKRYLLASLFILIFGMTNAQNPWYNITNYGADNSGKKLSTAAIQKAIDQCAAKGGGTVYIPAGRFLSGTIFLKSFVTLHLETGAVLEGSKNLADYPVSIPKIRSYTDNYTEKSLIYGEGLEHIAITGQGTIDGNGASFLVSREFREKDLFTSYKLRPYMIRIISCRNVTVKNITLKNSPMWVQHYLACENVNIDGITVISQVNNNNDGIDIDACDKVTISNCNILSGDDAIVIKSTLDRPCSNVTVTNCVISSHCNAFKLGTESNGDFHNINLSNCTFYNTRLAGIALEMVDGGSLNNVTVSDVNMDSIGCAIFVRLGNRARPFKENMEKPGMGKLFNVMISNIQATNIGRTGCSITGLPAFDASAITLDNIRISFQGGGSQDLVNRTIGELPEKYPEFGMFGTLPAYGFFCRHVTGLVMNNIELSYNKPDYRPAIILKDVKASRISDLRAFSEMKNQMIVLDSTENITLRDCSILNKNGIPATILDLTSQNMPGKVDCTPVKCDDREIRIQTPGDIINKRLEIIRAIWNSAKIPDRADVILTRGIQSPLHPHDVIERVDRLEIPVPGLDSIRDLAYLFVPVKRNNRLIAFCPGHSCTLIDDESHYSRIEATITGLLEAGYDVLSVYMPHVKETNERCRFDHCSVYNEDAGKPGQLPTYGLRKFLDPTIVSMNFLLKNNNYKRVDMVGLSGGGWTTNLIAALDDRIKYSFNVAGSTPLFYRVGSSIGDIEQSVPFLYRDIAGYPDLYVLGAFGEGRKQVQILNRKDNCCFGQKQHDPGRNYDEDMRTFEKSVKDRLEAMGEKNHYYLVIDETSPNHQISEYALKNIILPELNKKKARLD